MQNKMKKGYRYVNGLKDNNQIICQYAYNFKILYGQM